jgi:hypothetical protein
LKSRATAAAWATWNRSEAYTVGLEEEVMLLDPERWALAHRVPGR